MALLDYNKLQPTVKLQTPFEIEQEYQQIQQGRNQNKLAQMKFAEAEREGVERNALTDIAKQYGNTPEYGNQLYKGGFAKEGQAQDKYLSDREMAGAELKNKQMTGQKLGFDISQNDRIAAAQRLGELRGQPYEAVIQDMESGFRDAVAAKKITPEEAQQKYDLMLQKIPRDQAGIDAFIDRTVLSVTTPQQQVDSRFKEREFRRQSANDLIQPDGSVNEALVGAKSRVAQAGANMQYVPGNDYKPSGVFNPRNGQFIPSATPEQMPEVQPDQMAPWNNLPPKKADDMKARLYPTESKKLDDLREQVEKGRGMLRDLDRFGELNRKTGTGGVIDRVSAIPTFNDDKQEMESISARLAPSARPAGSGATSDRDIGLYLKGLPGADKHGNVNSNIRTSYMKSMAEAEKSLEFAENYFAEKGHLNGWNAAYKASKGKTPPAGNTKPPAATNPKFPGFSIVK